MPEFTITDENGETATIDLPAGFTDIFVENDESGPDVLADILLLGATQQVHSLVHHSQGETPHEIEHLEQELLSEFEAHFGQSFGDMTGHSH